LRACHIFVFWDFYYLLLVLGQRLNRGLAQRNTIDMGLLLRRKKPVQKTPAVPGRFKRLVSRVSDSIAFARQNRAHRRAAKKADAELRAMASRSRSASAVSSEKPVVSKSKWFSVGARIRNWRSARRETSDRETKKQIDALVLLTRKRDRLIEELAGGWNPLTRVARGSHATINAGVRGMALHDPKVAAIQREINSVLESLTGSSFEGRKLKRISFQNLQGFLGSDYRVSNLNWSGSVPKRGKNAFWDLGIHPQS